MTAVSIRIINHSGKVEKESKSQSLPCLIGRDPTCQLPINDASISRRHVLIEERQGQVELTDQKSLNGMRNEQGQKIQSLLIQSQVRVKVGDLWLEVMLENPGEHTKFSNAQIGNGPLSLKKKPFQHDLKVSQLGLAQNDWIDSLIRFSAHMKGLLVAILSHLIGVFYFSEWAPQSQFILFLSSFGMNCLSAVIRSTTFYFIAKFFKRAVQFNEICCFNILFLCLSSSFLSLSRGMARIHPEGSIGAVVFTDCSLLVTYMSWIINLRLINSGRFRGKVVIIVSVVMCVFSILMLNRDVQKLRSRWNTILAVPSLTISEKGASESTYVTTEQLISEIRQSLNTLRP